MNDRQIVTVNLHNPRVQNIVRHETGTLAITLGNGDEYAGHVNVFTTDEEWNEVRVAVLDFQVAEHRAKNTSGDRYCPECSFIGVDKDAVTEHVFANHPQEVAK